MSYRAFHRLFALIVGLVSFGFITLFAGMTASAATVTMEYTGPEGNSSGNVYVYPYDFSINSSITTYSLMCDDFVHMISSPQTWTANTLNASDLNSSTVLGLNYPSAGVEDYLEACYLFEEEVSAYKAGNSDAGGLYNWAVWDLLTGVDESASDPYGSLTTSQQDTIQSYENAAKAMGPSLTPSEFSNVIIYTPTDMSSDGPQEFMGMVPEPCTFAILGIGAFGLLARRQRTAAR